MLASITLKTKSQAMAWDAINPACQSGPCPLPRSTHLSSPSNTQLWCSNHPQVTCRSLGLTHFLLPLPFFTWYTGTCALGFCSWLRLPSFRNLFPTLPTLTLCISLHILYYTGIALSCPRNGQILATFPPVSLTVERYKVPEGKKKA